MKLLALVKHAPDSTSNITVKADGSGIETAGIKFVMNPFCEFAVEAALQFREKNAAAAAEVTAMTLGPADSVASLRTAYAMGVDSVVHLCDDAFETLDDLMVARVLAAAIKDGGYDIIFCGKSAIDYDCGQVGPALAECLGLPHVGTVTNIEWGDGLKSATARRRIEGAEEVVEVQLPAIFAIDKGYVEPRYPSLPGLMKAKKKPVEVKDAASLGFVAEQLAASAMGTTMAQFAPPPPRPDGRKIEGDAAEAAKELVRILRDEEKII